MSSDSSEDENSDLLREAVDAQFINDDMFSDSNRAKKSQQKQKQAYVNGDVKNVPSLRPNINKDDQFNMLGVTPQFQEYVARRLSSILENKLQKIQADAVTSNVPQKRKKSGIKLFSNSTKRLKLPKSNDLIRTAVRKRREIQRNASDSDNESKCSEVVVDPEEILSKKDTENWSSRSKAPVFKYKKAQNGTLTLLE